MARYAYKYVMDLIPEEFINHGGRDGDDLCSADYDGCLWIHAADYIHRLKSEIESLKSAALRERIK